VEASDEEEEEVRDLVVYCFVLFIDGFCLRLTRHLSDARASFTVTCLILKSHMYIGRQKIVYTSGSGARGVCVSV
jgi:hypothetical protein